VGKIRELIDELKLSVREKHLVVDRAPEKLDPGFSQEIEKQELDLLGMVPVDPFICEYELRGKPLLDLPDESPAVQVIAGMMGKMIH
jgi:CO dehydrogenase maturation factor